MFRLCLVFVLAVSAFARSPMSVGGVNQADNKEQISDAAHFAANTINALSRVEHMTDQKWYTLTLINNPTQQVISGYIYTMEVVLQQSDCINSDTNKGATVDQCVPVVGNSKRCQITVLDVAGEGGFSLGESTCST